MKQCKNCGSKMVPNASFCPACGKPAKNKKSIMPFIIGIASTAIIALAVLIFVIPMIQENMNAGEVPQLRVFIDDTDYDSDEEARIINRMFNNLVPPRDANTSIEPIATIPSASGDTDPIRVLVVPIITNYSSDIIPCQSGWVEDFTLFTVLYQGIRTDVEFVLVRELNLSESDFDINTDRGSKRIWDELAGLQSPDDDYAMIIGFVPSSMVLNDTRISGYSYGGITHIICELSRDSLMTALSEIES
jgi:hypothetical protein